MFIRIQLVYLKIKRNLVYYRKIYRCYIDIILGGILRK